MAVLSNPTGHRLAPDPAAGAGDNRVKVTDHLPAQVAVGDSGARLAVLNAKGAKDLQSVVMGLVANLMDRARKTSQRRAVVIEERLLQPRRLPLLIIRG